MFNEKNITQALTQLTNMYEMEHTMRQFGDICFEDLYLPDVCMALMNRVQTVFQYEVNSEDSPCFQYRGGDLFGQRACKVFEEFILSTSFFMVSQLGKQGKPVQVHSFLQILLAEHFAKTACWGQPPVPGTFSFREWLRSKNCYK